MQQKHTFDPKAFRKHRIPLLLIAMLPSFLLDVYLAYGIATHQQSFLIPSEMKSIWNVAAPFAADFMMLKAPVIYVYSRIRLQRLVSYVRIDDQIVYRKSRMPLFARLNQGIAYHDDYYLRNIASVKQKQNGAIVITGDIKVFRKLFGVEAVMRQRKISRLIIPPYYTDMGNIVHKLQNISRLNAAAV